MTTPAVSPEAQVKAQNAAARLNATMAKEANALGVPRVINTADGPAVFIPDIPGTRNAEPAQLADPSDYPDGDPDSLLPWCAFPGCKARAQHQLGMFNQRGLTLKRRRDGVVEIVKAAYVPLVAEGISAIGPIALQQQIAAARRQPNAFIDLCQTHYRLDYPVAAEAPKKVYTSGPYSILGAQRRAARVRAAMGTEPRVFERMVDGVPRSFVNGDSSEVPGWSGTMTPAE